MATLDNSLIEWTKWIENILKGPIFVTTDWESMSHWFVIEQLTNSFNNNQHPNEEIAIQKDTGLDGDRIKSTLIEPDPQVKSA